MTDTNTNAGTVDDLADLGLDLGGADAAPVENQSEVDASEVSETTEEAKTRKAVTLGEVTTSEEPEELDDIKRGGGGSRDSKYDFSDIKAPVDKGEGKFAYFSKMYKPGEGTEIEELDRSVKSAATAATREARTNGSPERYATRAVVENGVQTGTKVVRIDNTTGIDEQYAARAKRGDKAAK